MILCKFEFTNAIGGGYVASCKTCNRVVRTRTQSVTAACRINQEPVSHEQVVEAAQMSRVVKPALGDGPGAHLKYILKTFIGVVPSGQCACNQTASKMDTLGPEWCESNEGMAEIVGVMRDEHAKRKAAGKTVLPWSDYGAKQLVRLACRRARASAKTPAHS